MTAGNPNTAKPPAKWPRRRAALALSTVALLSCGVAVALARLAPDAAPVRAGSAQDFWSVVCGEKRYPPGVFAYWDAYATSHGSFLYEDCGLESTVLYEASEADVRSQFEQVVANLAEPNASLRPHVIDGFKAWQANLRDSDRTPESLVNAIDEAQFSKVKADHPEAYFYHRRLREEVEERRERANWFWAAVVFEWAFLTGWLLWVSWPIIRGGGRVRWTVHLGAAPLLLYLPLYFDYAPYLYTSAEPSGGILYPWVVGWFRGVSGWPLAQCDVWILRHMPPLLEPLSPKLGPIMAMTSFGIPGPTQMVGIGAFLALAILCGPRLMRFLVAQLKAATAAHRRPGEPTPQPLTDPVSANQSAPHPSPPAPG